jgi:hypothetical protein
LSVNPNNKNDLPWPDCEASENLKKQKKRLEAELLQEPNLPLHRKTEVESALYLIDITLRERAKRQNPIKANQLYFWQRGRRRVGWIGQSTPTRYRIDYREHPRDKVYRSVWRKKNQVEFMLTGKKGRLKRRNVSKAAIRRAVKQSRDFHGFDPRRLKRVKINWPTALTQLGHVVRLDYLSDKEDRQKRIYTHDFDKPPTLYATGRNERGQKNLLLLRGSFIIAKEGIVG